jgi:ATP-binding cassette subfamily F protein uup
MTWIFLRSKSSRRPAGISVASVLLTPYRYMLDRVSTTVLGLAGLGGTERFADYSQWEAWLEERAQAGKDAPVERKTSTVAALAASTGKKKLSYLEAREYAGIEEQIAQAEELLKKRQAALEDPAIASDAAGLVRAGSELTQAQSSLDRLYARWHELEEKQG